MLKIREKRRERARAPPHAVLALIVVAAATATAAAVSVQAAGGAAAATQPAGGLAAVGSHTDGSSSSSSSSSGYAAAPQHTFRSACAKGGVPARAAAVDPAFAAAAANALAGDARLTIRGARVEGACASAGLVTLGRGGGGAGSGSAARGLARELGSAVVLSTGAAELAAAPTRRAGDAAAPDGSGSGITRSAGSSSSSSAGAAGYDAAALEFTVKVAADAPEGLQLVMKFVFATEEGRRGGGAGAARPDAAVVTIAPAGNGGRGSGGEGVARLPGADGVDAAAALKAGAALLVDNAGGEQATALSAFTKVRGGVQQLQMRESAACAALV